MKEFTFLWLAILLVILSKSPSYACQRERCCSLNPCTANHCSQRNQQSWNSSQNYQQYRFTKLVLVNSSCKPCAYDCQSCQSESNCTICAKNFFMESQQCFICPYGCTKCFRSNGLLRCTQCQLGTYLDSISSSCKSCPFGARSCSSRNIISQCQPTFRKASNSLFCIKCSNNCSYCPNSDTECRTCQTGFYLKNNQCFVCNISNCTSCLSISNNIYCTRCQLSYYVNSSRCSSCPLNCHTCQSSSNCSQCSTNYYLNGNTCTAIIALIQNCEVYKSASQCLQCASSYYLKNTKCYPCSILCDQCYGDHFGLCSTCTTQSTLFNQMCLINNFLTESTYQLYYSFPASNHLIQNGQIHCGSLLIGRSISIGLNNLKAMNIKLKWKIFSIASATNYNAKLININHTEIVEKKTSIPYEFCLAEPNVKYHLSIAQHTFHSVRKLNFLEFSSLNQQLALQQIILVAYLCNQLCIECSQGECFECLNSNLYVQDSSCVFGCSIGYFTQSGTIKKCLKQCPINTYPQVSNSTCLACINPCQSCSSSSYCLSCINGFFLTANNTCQLTCIFRQYGRPQTRTCQSCEGRCLQCTSQQICTSCRIGFLFNNSCVDQCTPTFGVATVMYASLTNLSCMPCNILCLQCEFESNHCLQCKNTTYLHQNTCLDYCPQFYFASQNNTCQLCQYPCQSCSNNSSNCNSCINQYLLTNQCIISCPNGYYEDLYLLKCINCDIRCTVCYGNSSYCLSCKDGYFFFQNSCLQHCPPSYYNISSNCRPCSGKCQLCKDQNTCLSCLSNFLLINLCVRQLQCLPGTFANIDTLNCTVCAVKCATCQYTANRCTSCVNNQYLQSNICVINCSNHYNYPTIVESIRVCTPCLSPCLQCINRTACLSCQNGYKFSNNFCSSTCSAGTFFNSSISDCSKCTVNCVQCTSSQFCQICTQNYFIKFISSSINECVSSCGLGLYKQLLSSSCQLCLYPCIECQSSIDCLSCTVGILSQKRCITSCPQSTFLLNSSCQNCDSNCLTCTKFAKKCLSCPSNLFLESINDTCIKTCPTSTFPETQTQSCQSCPTVCDQCLNSTYCIKCIIGQTYLDQNINMCVTFCPDGQYNSRLTCQSCLQKCLTCTISPQNCLTCNTSYLLVRSLIQIDCQLTCPSSTYQEGSICYSCIFPCKTCNSTISCLSCRTGTFLFEKSHTCVLSCPSGTFYKLNSICSSCISPCKTCGNQTYCLGCQLNYFLLQGRCSMNCSQRYYAESGICNPCYGLCATCSSKFTCITCQTGFAYDGFCYSNCPLGTYGSTTQTSDKICQTCQYPCTECLINATYCHKCAGNLFAYSGQCTDSCPSGTYQQNNQCLSCEFPCVTCLNGHSCSACLGGYLLYQNQSCIPDVDRCPNDYYKMNSKYCVPQTWCPDSYFLDEILRTCSSSCNRTKYTNQNSKRCLKQCSEGQWVSSGLICTNYSSKVPQSLLGMTSISFIRSSNLQLVITFNESIIWLTKDEQVFKLSPLTTRLLQLNTYNLAYSLQLGDQSLLKFRPTTLPTRIQVNLAAYTIKSAVTGYPLQDTSLISILPEYTVYSRFHIYSGGIIRQFGQGISWLILLLSLFFLFKNRLSDLYIVWDTAQLLYILIFLNIQYPPSLNQFLLGLAGTHFNFVPSIFTVSQHRNYSDPPFYAYSYDNHFLRNAGRSILFVIIILGIFITLKILALLMNKVFRVTQWANNHPKIKRFVYNGILRYRWHHVNDMFFLTYSNVLLYALSQLNSLKNNPNNIFSSILSVICLLIWLLFPIFVGYKLYRHFPNISKGKLVINLKCFYRGIDKTNQFGVSLILIRYARKFIYALVIALFSSNPLYALPILMFCSVLFALFLFIHLPYHKKLSNFIAIATQSVISLCFLLIAIIQFSEQSFSINVKQNIGWVCCLLLAITIFGLIYEVFCKTMFYLEPQTTIKKVKEQSEDIDQLRKKAEEFYDKIFPELRQYFNLDEDSDQQNYHYEEGDSMNSQNNELRQKDWGLQSQQHEQQFKHYQNNTNSQNHQSQNQQPNYLIRCVKKIQ